MIDPRTAATGRATVYAAVEVCDHERGEWMEWLPADLVGAASADELVQRAVDAGHDDIRLVVHVSGAGAPARSHARG